MGSVVFLPVGMSMARVAPGSLVSKECSGRWGRMVRSRSADGAAGTGPGPAAVGLGAAVGCSARRVGAAGPARPAAGGAGCPDGPGRGRHRRRGRRAPAARRTGSRRSEEHTSELQSPIDISYAVFCLNKKTTPLPQYAKDYDIKYKRKIT